MKLSEQKSALIKQVKLLEDEQLISTIKGLVEYGLKTQAEQDIYNIPESHKKLVRKRIKDSKPSDYLDWNTVNKKFRS